jgi:GR25 family glycosyltransferase involved in LPS biosynthesis
MTHDINTYVDRIFYINMDKDVKRNEAIIKEFNKNNIWNFERISGVVVTDIPANKIQGPFIDNQDKEKYIRGSIGCLLSHKKIIEIALERGYSRICVLEDDVYFVENFEEQFSKYVDNLNANVPYQIAYLGVVDSDNVIDDREIKKLKNHAFGAFAYMMNDLNWVFKYILLNIDYQFQEIDLMYNSMISKNDLADCYISIPKLVLHGDPYDSNIVNRENSSK